MPTLRLDAIIRYDVDHLLDGIAYWDRAQANWAFQFTKTRADIDGLNWIGHAGDEALARAAQDERSAADTAAVLSAALQSARQEIDALTVLRSKVLSNVAAATEDGFRVNDDLSVQDLMTDYDDAGTAQSRQCAAEQHCADIYAAATALYRYDEHVAGLFRAHRADLRMLVSDGQAR